MIRLICALTKCTLCIVCTCARTCTTTATRKATRCLFFSFKPHTINKTHVRGAFSVQEPLVHFVVHRRFQNFVELSQMLTPAAQGMCKRRQVFAQTILVIVFCALSFFCFVFCFSCSFSIGSLPPMPPKTIFGRFEPALVESRRAQLERCLQVWNPLLEKKNKTAFLHFKNKQYALVTRHQPGYRKEPRVAKASRHHKFLYAWANCC